MRIRFCALGRSITLTPPVAASSRDRRGQLGKTQRTAAGNRQLLDFCFRDEGACVRPRRFHDRRMRVERDRFGQGCPAKLQIE